MSFRSARHIVVTGASGYIGRHLVRIALGQGRDVTVAGRNNSQLASRVHFARWALGDRLPRLNHAAQSTALIHLAHDWRDRSTEGSNAVGTRALFSDARAQGLERFVFASSLSARRDALNAYGRIKFAIEQFLDRSDAVSARLGLVYGGASTGMYGLLTKLTLAFPVLPMVDPGRPVQPIHVDEVCRGLLALADGEMNGWVGLAGPDPICFSDFMKILAQEGRARSLHIVPIPLRVALLAAEASARMPFGPRIDRERILGLAGTQVLDCRQDLAALGLSVLPVREGLRKDVVGTKALLAEARVNCEFILGIRPSQSLLRRYVRTIRALEELPAPLALPRVAITAPTFLRFFEPLDRSSVLAHRLRVAMALSEMSADYDRILTRCVGQSQIRQLWSTALLIAVESLAFPFRLLCRWRS